MRHKTHTASAQTDCAKLKNAVKLYEVNDNRAGSLQPSKIVALAFSAESPVMSLMLSCTFAYDEEICVKDDILRTIYFNAP
jgi:hypothetical protein